MTLIEAIKSGKPFKHKGDHEYCNTYSEYVNAVTDLSEKLLLSESWIIDEDPLKSKILKVCNRDLRDLLAKYLDPSIVKIILEELSKEVRLNG